MQPFDKFIFDKFKKWMRETCKTNPTFDIYHRKCNRKIQ